MHAAQRDRTRPGNPLPAWPVAIGYVLVFLVLDWVSYIRPFQGLNVTPWNPQPALAIALLLWNRRWLWLVWISLITAELAVRGIPQDWLVTLAATAALSLAYAAIARAASLYLDRGSVLASRRDLLRFGVITIGGALLNGTVYLTTFAVADWSSAGSLLDAIARYWVGDAVGLVVTLPMLLVLMDPVRRVALLATLRDYQGWTIALLIAALQWVVFGRDDSEYFKLFYLLVLPVVWASARLGLPGAILSAGLTQIGLIVGVSSLPGQDLTVFELQALMAALTLTGLLLAVAVEERERAQADLKRSLRLAAAGQVAAALAHELSQPLTALSSYAEACRTLVTGPGGPDAQRLAQLEEVARRIVDDAQRASDVVKRLRDFFRTGTTELRPSPLRQVLVEAAEAHARRAAVLEVDLRLELADPLPTLWIDALQISVVLRNLLANALDAVSSAAPPRQVTLGAALDGKHVAILVEDSGEGVAAAQLQSLFEPGHSTKPGGMGIGLSICRAIVEAHGGSLWAEPGAGGRFWLTLPLEAAGPEDERHAP